MDSKPSSRFAVVDFDETLIDGVLATKLAKAILNPKKNRGIIPKIYYIKFVRYTHLPFLTRLKRFYRIYRYLLRRTFDLYLSLLNDPRVDKESLFSLFRSVVDELEIPEISLKFLKKLKERGYTVVLLTAIPQEIAELLRKRIPVDVVVGSRPDLILDREGKESVLRRLSREGTVEIIVGNPGHEPFWLAERLAIMVRSPRDLSRWLDRI